MNNNILIIIDAFLMIEMHLNIYNFFLNIINNNNNFIIFARNIIKIR